MKTKIILILALIVVSLKELSSQVIINNFPPNTWVGYDVTTGVGQRRALGLGGTPGAGGFAGFAGGHPRARFHVSDFGMGNFTISPIIAGDLLRTDGLFANTNTWSMFTGANAAASLPRFNFTVPGGTSNLVVNTLQPNSNIFLNANGNNMVQITSTAGNGNNNTGQFLLQPDPLLPDPFPLMDIGGTIRFSEPLAIVGLAENTLFYGYTTAQGNPNLGTQDGFRTKYMNNAQAPFEDCLVFEKTDANGIDPDGCIRFTNTGNDGVEELAMTIEGNNFVGVGTTYTGAGGTNLLPWRRLSVNDPNGPQLRLTNVVGNTQNNGLYTDMNTTAAGNLEIDPRNNGVAVANIGNVRINYGLANPAGFAGLSLDVNGQQNIRTVNQDSTLNQILVWEPVSGNIRWRNANTLATGTGVANNGLSVTAGDTIQLGQNINAPGNPAILFNSREIPMDGNNIYFLGQDTSQGVNSVGVGFDPNVWPVMPARLGAFDEAGVGLTIGRTSILGWNRNFANSINQQQFVGVAGLSDGQETLTAKIFHIGGVFSAQHAPANFGVYGKVIGTDTIMLNNFAGRFETNVNHIAAANTGVLITAMEGNSVIGETILALEGDVLTEGLNITAGNDFGTNTGIIIGASIRAQTLNAAVPGSVGLQVVIEQDTSITSFPSGFFDGGNVVTTHAFVTISDSSCKRNIHDCTSGLSLLDQLHPVTYQYKTAEMQPNIYLPTGTHFGLLAQEVEAVIPSLVHTINTAPEYDTLGVEIKPSTTYKGVNYGEIIPILIDAVQEQQNIINNRDSIVDSLQQQLSSQANQLATMQQQMDDMMAMITNCCSQGNSLNAPNTNGNNGTTEPNSFTYQPVHTTEVRLTDAYCVLGENSPNPFRDHTVINYNLSETIQSAQIVFYNAVGQVIKVLEINDRGEGRLNVYGEDLRSGMYTYSLIIDGNVCESKKMIKE